MLAALLLFAPPLNRLDPLAISEKPVIGTSGFEVTQQVDGRAYSTLFLSEPMQVSLVVTQTPTVDRDKVPSLFRSLFPDAPTPVTVEDALAVIVTQVGEKTALFTLPDKLILSGNVWFAPTVAKKNTPEIAFDPVTGVFGLAFTVYDGGRGHLVALRVAEELSVEAFEPFEKDAPTLAELARTACHAKTPSKRHFPVTIPRDKIKADGTLDSL